MNGPTLENIDAERAVLGRILSNGDDYSNIRDTIKPESFSDRRNAAIFRGFEVLMASKGIATKEMLLGQLDDGVEDGISLSTYLTGLNAQGARDHTQPIETLVEVVTHAAARRDLVAAADMIRDNALAASYTTPIDTVRQAAVAIIESTDNRPAVEAKPIGQVLGNVISTAHLAVKSGVRPGIRTGLKALDELMGPLMPGNLVVVAGETSSGKTALVMQIAYLVAMQGIPARVSSLEQGEDELAIRYLSKFTDIPSERIMDAELTDRDLDEMMRAGSDMVDLALTIDDAPRQTVGMLHARIARAIKSHGCKLAIIDHLQYVLADNRRGNEKEQIKQVVDDIKAMAKRLQIPVILVSHVTRPFEARPISRASDIRLPTLNNLYGSSAIEKAADAVVFVHRPLWFLQRQKPLPQHEAEHATDLIRWTGRAMLVLPKRRMGAGFGTRECEFDESRTWFSDFKEWNPEWRL